MVICSGLYILYTICGLQWIANLNIAGCRVPSDVAFALDSSGSIGQEDFERSIQFAKAVAGRLPIERGTSVAMITYSSDVTVRNKTSLKGCKEKKWKGKCY